MTTESEARTAPTEWLGREFVFTRTFGAPRELVFQMWTDPEHFAQWFGPWNFTIPVCELDPRPGGAILVHMRSVDGQVFPMTGTYHEVVRPERVVFTSAVPDGKGGSLFEVHNTVVFADEGDGRTKQTLKARVLRLQPGAEKYLSGMEEGWNQALEGLGRHVASERRGKPGGEFVISREFDAPRDVVWRAWTEREQMMRWFGPKGFPMTHAQLEFRVGGSFHYCLRMPNGGEMWGKFLYREIAPPERIVWVSMFSDAGGGMTRHPMDSAWPQRMLTTATFEALGGRTRITIRWAALNASAAEHEKFDTSHDGMRMGWTGTFEQLAEHLAKG